VVDHQDDNSIALKQLVFFHDLLKPALKSKPQTQKPKTKNEKERTEQRWQKEQQ